MCARCYVALGVLSLPEGVSFDFKELVSLSGKALLDTLR